MGASMSSHDLERSVTDYGGRRSVFDRRITAGKRRYVDRRSGGRRRSGFDRRHVVNNTKVYTKTERRMLFEPFMDFNLQYAESDHEKDGTYE